MSNEVEDQGGDQVMVDLYPSLEIVDSSGSWRNQTTWCKIDSMIRSVSYSLTVENFWEDKIE